MRSFCIENNIRTVYGIMTNFKEWIFTRYDLVSEAAKIIDIKENDKNPFKDFIVYQQGWLWKRNVTC